MRPNWKCITEERFDNQQYVFPTQQADVLRLVHGAQKDNNVSDLLRGKYNIQKDYEWYSEDFIGSELDTPTDIRVEDVFSLCTGRIEKIIGTTL